MLIDVIIPVFNEEASIGLVIDDIPSFVRYVVVANNGSTDATAKVAESHGAIVVTETQKGYGSACLCGIRYLKSLSKQPDVVVFLDGDYSDYPSQMGDVIAPLVNEDVDLVIGSRALGQREAGSMTPPQIFGNWLSTTLIRWLYGYSFTDLGPFRGITWEALERLEMKDKTYGWTVEMQVKAANLKMKTAEVPVDYKKRIGVSKISGTVKGTFLAGYKILATIYKYHAFKNK